jgi:tetratricopeptide (TPR) repeat protein
MKTVFLGVFLFISLILLIGCAKNPQKHFDEGDMLFEQGLYDEAIEAYKKAIKMKPDWALAHNNLGLAYSKYNQKDLAIEEYNEAIRLDPHLGEAYYNLASIYYDRRSFEQAISFYKKTLEVNPNMAEAHYNLGAAYYETQQYDLAWKEAQEAEKLGYDAKILIDALNSVSR